jgi:hypothetical protein
MPRADAITPMSLGSGSSFSMLMPTRKQSGPGIRATHGVHQLRHDWCRCPAELARALRRRPDHARPLAMAAIADLPHISRQMEPRTVPNLNTGKPWSEMDDEDLRASIAAGDTSKTAAEFLCRNANEVRKRAKELGLTWRARPILRRERPAKAAKPERAMHRWKGRLVPDKTR